MLYRLKILMSCPLGTLVTSNLDSTLPSSGSTSNTSAYTLPSDLEIQGAASWEILMGPWPRPTPDMAALQPNELGGAPVTLRSTIL